MAEKRKKEPEKMTFEEASARLEKIVNTLETGAEPLDKMLALYEEGTALLRRANALLADAEARVQKVTPEGETAPFEG